MHLYHLTLQRASCVTSAALGNFSGQKVQELAIARGTWLEMHRPDVNTGKIYQVYSTQVFGIIRSLAAFRLMGSSKDYLVVGADSGKITILEFNIERNQFEKVHQETFGKTGCRRIVPGQFLAIEPKGRAIMIAAPEKQKLVYITNRDAANRLTISSPLEANKSNTLLFHVAAVDNGFGNPTFACLELDHTEADEDPTGEALEEVRQHLVYYVLDLGLNNVVRERSDPLDDVANYLITVPSPGDGPGGIIVCSDNFMTFKNVDQSDIRIPIPRRKGDLSDPERGSIVVTHASLKTKQFTFFLVQTDQGDLFKVTLQYSDQPDDVSVVDMSIKYFDTIPVAVSLCLLKNGFLFCASEFSNHYFYQILNLGDDDADAVFNKDTPYGENEWPHFAVRPLANLEPIDEMESLSPILDCKIANLSHDDTPQFYTACGRGHRSSFRILRHGLEVTELAVSPLPGNASAIWTCRRNINDDSDAYIVVSFLNATIVLAIGETVEEVHDTGFLDKTSTLSASTIGDDCLLQVYPGGVRLIRPDGRHIDWKPPGTHTVTHAAVNGRQVAIALSATEVVYFELDAAGQLNEHSDRFNPGSDITCLAMGALPEGRQRSRFLAVGVADNTVRVVALDPEDCLEPLAMQACPVPASSLCLVQMEDSVDTGEQQALYLNIGLSNGVMLRTIVDPISGTLTDTRTRYLGSKPVKLFRIKIQGKDSVLALSSRPWLSYPYQGRLMTTPLSYEMLTHGAGFTSEQCPEGVVALAEGTLRIISMEKLGGAFNQVGVPLTYTPRQLVIHPESNMMVVIESDHNCLSDKAMREQNMETDDTPDPAVFGRPKPGASVWASQLRIIDPSTNETADVYDFTDNECAVSLVACNFHGNEGSFIIVGTAKNQVLQPRKCDGGALYVFRTINNGRTLDLVHKTPVEDIPQALCAFQGRVLAGVGRMLRLYDLGKRKLLRKCENKHIPNLIVKIMTSGSRIFVGDVQESWHFIKFKAEQNQMVVFADDTVPRFVTTGCVLDYDTICGADKFGNVYVLRAQSGTIDDIDDDPTGAKAVWQRGLLGGAPQKVECVAQFYVGEAVKTLQKVTLIAGGGECIAYTTLSGGIGILAPFASKSDVDFMQHLEMFLQQHNPPLLGRDHLAYRSYYAPRKAVLDGDLIEQFNTMALSKRKEVAEELERTPQEVSKKLEDMRARYAF